MATENDKRTETGKAGRAEEDGRRMEPYTDIHDSKRDEERLKPDEATIDLPDVTDIPGQEHVTVPPLGEMGDTTASSADEEYTI
ncbi:MAG TPA: hypothetical protein VLC28_10010 [Flavitalea sp.]|nr:hypothetical protein [Flavitalea sp.]